MNENIDLTKILDGCPKGTEFYSSIWGTVTFIGIVDNINYPIRIKSYNKINGESHTQGVTKDGIYCCAYNGECTLFPSKDQKDWSKFERFWDKPKVEKFDVNTLHPFDKILARDGDKQSWNCEFFSHINNICQYSIIGLGLSYKWCIPYNEETKHLIGTTNDCPDYYKWWEKQL